MNEDEAGDAEESEDEDGVEAEAEAGIDKWIEYLLVEIGLLCHLKRLLLFVELLHLLVAAQAYRENGPSAAILREKKIRLV